MRTIISNYLDGAILEVDVDELVDKLYAAGYRKQSDTIREFANKLKALPNRDYAHSYQLGCLVLSDKDINELAVEYGVEVE